MDGGAGDAGGGGGEGVGVGVEEVRGELDVDKFVEGLVVEGAEAVGDIFDEGVVEVYAEP